MVDPRIPAIVPGFDAPFDAGYPYLRQHEQIMDTLATLEIPAIDLEGAEFRYR